MVEHKRLFVAISIPEHIRAELTQIDLSEAVFKPVTVDTYHLTLKFIGEVESPLAEAIAPALATIQQPTFTLKLAGVGYFLAQGKPNVVWAGLAGTPAALLQLKQTVDSTLANLAVNQELRPYRPHVTLARCHSGPLEAIHQWVECYQTFNTSPFPVENFHLYSSQTTPQGPHYAVEATFSLS